MQLRHVGQQHKNTLAEFNKLKPSFTGIRHTETRT